VYDFASPWGSGGTDTTPDFKIPNWIEDRNGNKITVTGTSWSAFSYTDTLGRTLASATGNTVNIAGLSAPYNIVWTTSQSNFSVAWTPAPACYSGPHDFTNETQSVIYTIMLPNGKQYQFDYEPVYGLLKQITYPTGATIKYTWQFNPQSQGGHFQVQNPYPSPHWDTCAARYGMPALQSRTVSFDGVTPALEQDFTYSTSWPTGSEFWSSKHTTVVIHDLLRNTTSQVQYDYVPVRVTDSSTVPVEQRIQYQDGNGRPLRTVTKDWYSADALKTEQVILENAQTSQKAYTYLNQIGVLPTETDEYDFGPRAAGPLLKKILISYQSFGNTPIYPSGPSIFDRRSSIITYDGSGNRVAETDFAYDQTAVAPVSATGHDDNYYGSGFNVRGNLTTETRKCFVNSTACTDAVSTYTFDQTGQVLTVKDPCGNAVCNDMTGTSHTVTYSYTDSYTSCAGSPPPAGSTNAYLTTITDQLGHTANFCYGYLDGQLRSSTDQNTLTTSYQYNDSFARLTQANTPDGGQITNVYNDNGPSPTLTVSKKMNATQTATSMTVKDGVGHVKQTQLTSDPQGTVYADTAYDGVGRVYTVSNPYRTGADPTTSLGTTTYYYDAIGRKCLEAGPDGSPPTGGTCPAMPLANDLSTMYSGNTTTVTDQTNRARKSIIDGLGRLIQVFEDPAGLNYETDYAYDALGNLLTVNQKGGTTDTTKWRSRTFSYDSLSRLLTSNNPEVGTITYTYDANGNLATKRDARSVTTTYRYDALNRETSRIYSNGDPTVTSAYDEANCLGLAACQNIGHRTSITDAAGSAAWSYQVDATNNRSVHVEQRTTNSITKTFTYYLDLAGNVTQAIYPTGRTVNYTYDSANRPSTAIDGSNGITYATGFQTPPPGCPASAVCYTPQGTFYALSIGKTSSFTGLNITHTYNNRLQPSRFSASTGNTASVSASAAWISTPFLDRTRIDFTTPSPTNVSVGESITASGWTPSFINGNYFVFAVIDSTHFRVILNGPTDFGSGTNASGNLTFIPFAVDITYSFLQNGSLNAGHVNIIYNNLDSTRVQYFTYDQLHRIIAAQTGSTYASSPAHCWGETYNVDAWGNLQSIAATTDTSYTGCSQESGFNWAADGHNHLSGFSYDLSGNTQGDGVNSYTWDAESQLKSGAGVSYLYDGDGRRVSKVGSRLYWYGSGSEVLAETDTAGNTQNEYVFFGGKRIAMLPASSTPMYYLEDMLGTSRVITNSVGVVCYDADFYPYGGERPYTNTCPQNYKFEGKERDAETGNDDFGARYYSNRFGRWLSADWSAVAVPVPYANLSNPQTLNLYAMVADDPESFADLDGHCGTPEECSAAAERLLAPPLPPAKPPQPPQETNQQRREAVASTAENYNGRPDWAFTAQKGAFACNTNKCNAFVGDVTKEAGAPVSVTGSDGKSRYPLASELADKKKEIANWRVLGPGEKPQSGDIAAYKLSGGGRSYSGHSGIVTSVDRNGTVHAMAAHEKFVGPDDKFNSTPTRAVTYRRYEGDQ
jgi:RHS repeat-associated protein